MDMTSNRTFDWPGCVNARDLGGLPLGAGQFTRCGSIARADLLGRQGSALADISHEE